MTSPSGLRPVEPCCLYRVGVAHQGHLQQHHLLDASADFPWERDTCDRGMPYVSHTHRTIGSTSFHDRHHAAVWGVSCTYRRCKLGRSHILCASLRCAVVKTQEAFYQRSDARSAAYVWTALYCGSSSTSAGARAKVNSLLHWLDSFIRRHRSIRSEQNSDWVIGRNSIPFAKARRTTRDVVEFMNATARRDGHVTDYGQLVIKALNLALSRLHRRWIKPCSQHIFELNCSSDQHVFRTKRPIVSLKCL